MIADPRGGAITADATLVIVHHADGTAQTPDLERQFGCLQSTGDFCKD